MRGTRVMMGALAAAFWTAGLLVFQGLPLDQGPAEWRLRAVFLVAWILGLALGFVWLSRGAGWTVREGKDRAPEAADPATGLPGRDAFRGIVQDYLDACVEGDEKSLVILICVRDFEQIAETFGDEEAEKVIVRVSRALLDSMRGGDLIGRHERDEMAAFLPRASSASWEVIAGRVHSNVAFQNRNLRGPYEIRVSAGHAEFDPSSPQPLEILLRRAYGEMIRDLGR